MELILPGNPNLGTIQNVIYFVKAYYKNKTDKNISKVLFIDTEESVYKAGENIEGVRNEIVRRYLGKVQIESIMINQEDVHQIIPNIISNQKALYKADEIIVDLTNGNKFISNILYASASLSQIKNLFFLYVAYDKQKELPENLGEGDYTINVVSPMENIETIGNNAYFDIFYYRDKQQEIIEEFKKSNLKSNFLKNMFAMQINSAISDYFMGKYTETISLIGQITEELSIEVCSKIKNMAKGKITVQAPKDFQSACQWLRVQFCEPIREKNGKNEEYYDYEEKLKYLQNIDKLVEVIKAYRNLSSHPYDYLRGKEEAKIVLNNFLYITSIINKSEVLK